MIIPITQSQFLIQLNLMIKKHLPTIVAVLFFIFFQLIFFIVGNDFFNVYRSLGAGLITIIGYFIGKKIQKMLKE